MVSLSHFVWSPTPGFSEEGRGYTVGNWESTRILWSSTSFCFTASSCTSLMSQCYQLLISSLLGNVNMKQDLRQVLLIHVAETPTFPGAAVVRCRASPWKWWSPNRSVVTALLKLIVGTKAFHVNLMSAASLNLHSLQNVAFGFADSLS